MTTARFLCFGPFRWDTQNKLLLREDKEMALPPRVLAVLECLLDRPGQVIARQELIERVWRDAFVTDTSLAEAISGLRQALEDDAQSPRYVQTIHRRGYRFVAPVETEGTRPGAGPETAPELNGRVAGLRPSIGRDLLPWSLVVILGATLGVSLWKLTHPSAGLQPRVARFQLAAPAGTTLRDDTNSLAVSPDGRSFAFSACSEQGCRLYLRALDRVSARPLEGTADASAPFFAPDARWIGFFADGKLKKVPSEGGEPVVLCDAPDALGAAWLDDGRIVFAAHETGGLEWVSDSGGPAALFTQVNPKAAEVGHRWPQWLAGSDYIVFTATTAPADPSTDRAMAVTRDGRRMQVVAGRAAGARLIASDLLIFGRGIELHAARFDRARGLLSTSPARIAGELRSGRDGAPLLATSGEGTLLASFGAGELPALVLATAADRQPMPAAIRELRQPTLDPSGTRVAGIVSDGLRSELWTADARRGTITRLTHDRAAASPAWSADGRRVIFSASDGGPFNLWITDATAPAAHRFLTSTSHQFATAVTQEGQVVFTQIDPRTRGDIYLAGLDGRARPVVRTAFDERDGAISPDGQWLAYRSDESGRWQLYVKSLAGSARAVVSSAGGSRPWWLADGRLVYETSAGLLEQAYMTPEGPAPSSRERLPFAGPAITISSSGAALLAKSARQPDTLLIALHAAVEISRSLPPAVTNLPR